MKIIVFSLAGFLVTPSFAQKKKSTQPQIINVGMTPSDWNMTANEAEFINQGGTKAIAIKPNKTAIVKNLLFENGTIEFDVVPIDKFSFICYFRYESEKENDLFYIRTGSAANPNRKDGVQYSPTQKGVLPWDLFEHYQRPVKKYFPQAENHIKVIVSGAQMLVFINDMTQPVLEIPRLEGNVKKGALAFGGESIISNIKILPDATGGLSPLAGFDPLAHDPNIIRDWKISPNFKLPKGTELTNENVPASDSAWSVIHAGYYALINISNFYGESKERRATWLKATINSDQERSVKMNFGFGANEEIWIFINGQLVHLDKNFYRQPSMKVPEGRCSLQNSSFMLPLKKGKNDLLVGISQIGGQFSGVDGWGIMARLVSLVGLEILSPEQ